MTFGVYFNILKLMKFSKILLVVSFLFFFCLLFFNLNLFRKISPEKEKKVTEVEKSKKATPTALPPIESTEATFLPSATKPIEKGFEIVVRGPRNYRRLADDSLIFINFSGKIQEIKDKIITIERMGETEKIEITGDFEIFSLNYLEGKPIWEKNSFENLKIGNRVNLTLPDEDQGIKGKVVISEEKT